MGGFLKDKIQELREKFMAMGAWESSGDAESMWSRTITCIREGTKEMLGVLKRNFGGHRQNMRWNREY